MRILCVGGAGHVGSAIVARLVQSGHSVTVWDRLDRGMPKFPEGIMPGMISRDEFYLHGNASINTYDRVIWTSGYADVKYCNENPLQAYTGNTVHLFHMIKSCNIPVLYTSTVAVYENNSKPNGGYGKSKLLGDNLVFGAFPDKDVTAIRMGTVVGMSPNIRDNISVHAMMKSGVDTQRINLFGGELLRPILYIHDLCNFVEKWVTSPVKGIYPIYSEVLSFEEIAKTIVTWTAGYAETKWQIVKTKSTVQINDSINPTRYNTVQTYAWSPDYSLVDVLPELYKRYDRMHNVGLS